MKQGWEITKLGDVAVINTGNSAPQRKELFENGTYPFFRTSDAGKIKVGVINTSADNLNSDGIKGLKLFKTGTILFPKSGASTFLNHRVMMGVNGYVSSHLAAITADKNKLDENYLFYYLTTIDAKDLIQDIAYPSLKTSDIGSIPICLPGIKEQRQIVATLDNIFDLLKQASANAKQNLNNTKELFDSYLNAVLQNKKWPTKTLGEVCESVEYGSSSKSKKVGKIAVLRMGNIQNRKINWQDLAYSDNVEENKKYLLKYNDVLFNRTNSPELVGKTAIYKGEKPAIFAGYLIRINRNENLLDADYLNYFLNSQMAMNYGKSVVISSVNQANINGSKLKGYPIPLPPLKDQQIIVQKLDALSAECKKLEAIYLKKIEDLNELKKSILEKAFTGALKMVQSMTV